MACSTAQANSREENTVRVLVQFMGCWRRVAVSICLCHIGFVVQIVRYSAQAHSSHSTPPLYVQLYPSRFPRYAKPFVQSCPEALRTLMVSDCTSITVPLCGYLGRDICMTDCVLQRGVDAWMIPSDEQIDGIYIVSIGRALARMSDRRALWCFEWSVVVRRIA